MKGLATTRTAWLTICFASVSLLFSPGGSVLAQMSAMDFRYHGQVQAIQDKVQELRKAVETDDKAAFKTKLDQIMRSLEDLKEAQQALEPAIAGALAEAPFGTRVIGIEPVTEFVVVPSGPAGKRGIELKKRELETVMRSHGDKGLVTLLRFEKAKVCRKAKMYDEAVEELQKIIDENLADQTTNAARWTLVEILQEQKKNEEAIAELERIFVSASDIQDRTDAIYGIINLSGEGPKARIEAIERLIQALLRDQANWDGCTRNLEQLYAAERKYAEDHGGFLSHKLSDLYPDYVDNLDVFTCPASGDQKITRKEDIDSLTSYILVAKGQPAEGRDQVDVRAGGKGRPIGAVELWIREKEQNHGRRWLKVLSNGAVGWFAQ